MKIKNNKDVELRLQLITKHNNLYLSYNDNTWSFPFKDEAQVAWCLDNKPGNFMSWVNSLEIVDENADDCICSVEAYERALELGRKTGNMSNYVRCYPDGSPMPRSMQS